MVETNVETTVTTPGTRAQVRDSMMMSATLRRSASDVPPVPMRVRNISSGGLMGEAEIALAVGDTVELSLKTVGLIEGIVAWADDERFGIAFKVPVDRLRVRRNVPVKQLQATGAAPQGRRPGVRTA